MFKTEEFFRAKGNVKMKSIRVGVLASSWEAMKAISGVLMRGYVRRAKEHSVWRSCLDLVKKDEAGNECRFSITAPADDIETLYELVVLHHNAGSDFHKEMCVRVWLMKECGVPREDFFRGYRAVFGALLSALDLVRTTGVSLGEARDRAVAASLPAAGVLGREA